jgi:hypothetical protein
MLIKRDLEKNPVKLSQTAGRKRPRSLGDSGKKIEIPYFISVFLAE